MHGHTELEKNYLLSTLTFWGYRFGGKKTRKLQQFEIATKVCKSLIEYNLVKFGTNLVKFGKFGKPL